MLSVDVISSDVQRCYIPLVFQRQEETPHCVCKLQISSSLLSNDVKQVISYNSHRLEHRHLPFHGRIDGGACIARMERHCSPRFSAVELMLRTVPSHLSICK